MTDEQLAELSALEKQATPGPWSQGLLFNKFAVDTENEADPHNICYDVHREADAALIAAMRNALPAMLEQLAAQRTALEALSQALKEATSWLGVFCNQKQEMTETDHFNAHAALANARAALAEIRKLKGGEA